MRKPWQHKLRTPVFAAAGLAMLVATGCSDSDGEPPAEKSPRPASTASSSPAPPEVDEATLRKQAESGLPKGKPAKKGHASAREGIPRQQLTGLPGHGKRYVLEVVCAGSGSITLNWHAKATDAEDDPKIPCGNQGAHQFAFTNGVDFSFEVRPADVPGHIAWQVVRRDL